MPFTILLADDDDAVRKTHMYALEAAADGLGDTYTVVESDNSVDAWSKIRTDPFDLIVLDNDFKDTHLKGRLPGIALLQLARKEGANTGTPIVFCSAETFATLKPMVEKYSCVHLPKAGYDIDEAARIFAEQLKSKGKK